MVRKDRSVVAPQVRVRGEQPEGWREIAEQLSRAQASDLLTADDVARLLGLKRGKAFALMNNGNLPGIRIGTALRIQASDLEKWLRRDGAASLLRDQRRSTHRERGD